MFYSLISLCAHTIIDFTPTHTPTHTHTHVHTHTQPNHKTTKQTKQRVWKNSKKQTNWTNVSLIFNTATFATYFPTNFFFGLILLPLSLLVHIFEKLNQNVIFLCSQHTTFGLCVCFSPKSFESIIQTWTQPELKPINIFIYFVSFSFKHSLNYLMFLYVWLSISVSLSFSHSLSLSLSNCITV